MSTNSPVETAPSATALVRPAQPFKPNLSGMYWPSNLEASYAAAASAYSTSTALAAAGAAMTAVTSSPNLPCDTGSLMSTGYSPYAGGPGNGFLSSFGGVTRSFATSTTPTTPKKKPNPVPQHLKDDTYWERRKKNNDSARRSREARRLKEEQIAIRVVYLEQENLQLKTECQMLKLQIDKLTMMLYGSANQR